MPRFQKRNIQTQMEEQCRTLNQAKMHMLNTRGDKVGNAGAGAGQVRRDNERLLLVVLVDHDVSESRLAGLHILDNLVGVLEAADLNEGLEVLRRGELEHLLDNTGPTDETAADKGTSEDHLSERSGHGRVLGETDGDHLATRSQQPEVLVNGHIGVVVGGDQKVERSGVLLVGIVTLSSGKEVGGTELTSELLLAASLADGEDPLGAKSLGEDEAEVTKTTDTRDTNALDAGLTSAVRLERVVDGDATAHQRGSNDRVETLGDGHGEVSRDTGTGSVTALGPARAIGVVAVVSADDALLAPGLKTIVARVAVETRAALGTNADTLANLDVLDLAANTRGSTHNLVSNADRVLGRAPTAAESVEVRAADTAALDGDLDVGLLELLGLELLPLEVANAVSVMAHPAEELCVGSGHFSSDGRGLEKMKKVVFLEN